MQYNVIQVFGKRDLRIGTADPAEIEQREVQPDSPSPAPCLEEDIVKGCQSAHSVVFTHIYLSPVAIVYLAPSCLS